MAARTIATGIGTYQNPAGVWTFGQLGDEVDVHEDDLERFDRLNVIQGAEPEQKPGPVEGPAVPEGDPSEEWTVKELEAYASEHGVDLSDAKNKADKLAAVTAAASA